MYKESKIPSIKMQVEALENDICEWLTNNRSLSYKKKQQEILATLIELNLPSRIILELAAHMLIRMDNACFIVEEQKKFEPLISVGFKNLISRRRNASKPRKGGRITLINAVKYIMHKEKRDGHSFKEFLNNATNGSITDLEILDKKDGYYTIRIDENNRKIEASYRTLMDWYTDADKKNRK